MRLRISIRGHVRPSVRPSVGPSVRRSVRTSVGPVLFSNDDYGCFQGEKTSNNIKNNGTMSEDEVVASDVPPRYLFF